MLPDAIAILSVLRRGQPVPAVVDGFPTDPAPTISSGRQMAVARSAGRTDKGPHQKSEFFKREKQSQIESSAMKAVFPAQKLNFFIDFMGKLLI